MKYFIDTEFKEKPCTIDLISIGIVCEDGREYYALCNEFNLKEAWKDEWLREHVLLPIYKEYIHGDMQNVLAFSINSLKHVMKTFGKSKKQIANDLKIFCHHPEFYAYYASYDWVVFCWIFGRMLDLPKGFPMYCKDIKQMMDDKGLTKEWKRENCPDPIGEHNALIDARWNLNLYLKLIEIK